MPTLLCNSENDLGSLLHVAVIAPVSSGRPSKFLAQMRRDDRMRGKARPCGAERSAGTPTPLNS